jgi:[NiFe] hydrogenase diaphorase moiety large subunit
VGPEGFDQIIGFEGLATGGSIIVIGKDRNLLEIVHNFMCFFTDESCGSCVPCRAGTWIMRNKVKRIMEGKGTAADLDMLVELGQVMKTMNRCGLGQTAGNPVVTTIQNMRSVYDAVVTGDDAFAPGFDLAAEVTESCAYVGRTPNL